MVTFPIFASSRFDGNNQIFEQCQQYNNSYEKVEKVR